MNLILRIIITGALLLLFACKSVYKADPFPEPERESGQTDVLALRAEPLDTVRVAFIGVGARGMAAVKRFMNIEGVRVVALCDVESKRRGFWLRRDEDRPWNIVAPIVGRRFVNEAM